MKHLINKIELLVVLSITPLFTEAQVLQFSSATIPVGLGPRSAVLMELNQDGNADLAVANMLGSNISLIYGDGSGTFTLQDSIATIHKGPHNIATDDFNGDGVLDVVTANKDSNTIAVFLGDGAGGLLP
ncbi:MAG: VCBS repeat-containing protein, partial [Bacteroidetes bacterium]|nr:VCBS repeat-containing protein [Bacteroidota bacterium]